MKEVLTSSSMYELTPCQLKLEWAGSGKPSPVSQKMILAGSKESKYFYVEYSPPPASEYCVDSNDQCTFD